MNTYLVVCGYIFNVIILLWVISCLTYFIFVAIKTRKINKRKRAKNARKQEQFEKELVLAKQKWQDWVKVRNDILQKIKEEKDNIKVWDHNTRLYHHHFPNGKYYFQSLQESIYFCELSEKYNWVLEDNQNQKEAKSC